MPNARIFEVPSMTCDHCRTAIEGEIKQLDGITEVVVDVDKKIVTVDGLAGTEAIVTAINEAGYDVASHGPAHGWTGPTGDADAPAPG